jgi:hypothetical protein
MLDRIYIKARTLYVYNLFSKISQSSCIYLNHIFKTGSTSIFMWLMGGQNPTLYKVQKNHNYTHCTTPLSETFKLHLMNWLCICFCYVRFGASYFSITNKATLTLAAIGTMSICTHSFSMAVMKTKITFINIRTLCIRPTCF